MVGRTAPDKVGGVGGRDGVRWRETEKDGGEREISGR